ncbi:MAG: hypothetical protein IPN88_09040 [Bacteroidetes bacterium]|nr:hypothetical protein [Bacteroidota bacterium]
MKEYIENNIEIYVSNVMNLIKGNSNESEEAITRIVTNKNVKPESKEKMLHNQNTIIQSLEKIDDLEIKKLLFAQNKIQPSWGKRI